MKTKLIRKSMILGIIALLIGMGIIQMVSGNELFFSNYKSYNSESIIELRNIMLTGYWNPTGQMIAPFSNDTYLNPDGWKGANWEGLDYNIYSYFPTPYTYNGTFEVDYQDTWEDFWNITDEIKPVAIISFGAGNGPWEIEYNARNLNSWVPDNKPPYQPTPCPPDDSVPPGYVRHSTLPVQAIADAVNDQTSVYAWIDWSGNPGAYLCEYIAYLGMWYKAIHNTTGDPYRCWEAGFIHVNPSITLQNAMEATNVTIREVIKSILNYPPNKPDIDGTNSGEPGIEYEYKLNAVDPDEDDVYYHIDWGDDNYETTDLNPSGTDLWVKHTWDEQGAFIIKVKAEDINGLISPEATLEVTISRYRKINIPFLQFFQQHPNLFQILQRLMLRLGLR